jgi:hypothetical protein
VSCGPALFVAASWTRPANGDARIGVYPGADYGETARAWCQLKAGRRMVPCYITSSILLAVGALLGLACALIRLVHRQRGPVVMVDA